MNFMHVLWEFEKKHDIHKIIIINFVLYLIISRVDDCYASGIQEHLIWLVLAL